MDTNQKPQTLSPNRTNSNCNSPEFEFWMLRNPSFPQPTLHTADELFVDGVILPLHLLPTITNKTDPPPQTLNSDPNLEPGPEPDSSQPESSPVITESSSSSTFSASKRWKDIFRKGEKNNAEEKEKEKEKEKKNKEKKKERKTGNGANSAAELNINIWPFSRSRSAGNTTRPKFFTGAPVTRKVNSAPCSRSNSAGESKSRKWPSSPGRAGVHVGRNSPVWQVRRGGGKNSEQQTQQGLNTEKELKKEATVSRRSKLVSGGGGGKAKVLSLNVPMCIGYRHHLSCRSDENSAIGVSGGAAVNRGGGDGGGECHHHDEGSGGNLFNLRNLFTKKSIVTSH